MYVDDYTGGNSDPYNPEGQQTAPWWEGPKPANWPTTWPPPLPPGAHYGNAPGSIVYAEPTAGGPPPGSGAPIDMNDPTPDGDPYPMYHPPTPTTTDPGPGSGGGGGNTGGGGSLLSPYGGQYQAPTWEGMPEVPVFHPPTYTPPPAFAGPTGDEVLNDPGYAFARDEGERALLQSKAAGGLMNSGGTLKDIVAWGGDYAQQRFGDVWSRKRNEYDTNYQTQYRDPYDFAYKGALDTFAPQMIGYQTNAAATQRHNEFAGNQAMEMFNFDYNKWRDQRDSTWNKNLQYAQT